MSSWRTLGGKALLMATVGSANLALAGTAMAQSVNADEQAAGERADDGAIIVTAQRRDERLQDVPITIANFSSEELDDAGVQSLSDIDKLASGIRFDKRTNFVVPTIRGITTPIVLAGGGSNIGVYIDGFYSPALQSSDFELLNVENIQVLKGPQGTLFGRNTNGGAILVNTADPSTERKLILEAGYGSYNALRIQGYTTVGLTDRIAVDFAGSMNRGDGWRTNIANGDDEIGKYLNLSARLGLKVDLTDNFSVVARYTHQDIDDPTNLLQVPYMLDGKPATIATFFPGAIIPTGRKEVSADEQFKFRYKANAYQLTATLELDSLTITSFTQYREDRQLEHRYSLDFTNIPLVGLNIQDFNDTFTQELLINSTGDGPLEYTLGAFYFDNEASFPDVTLSSGGGPFNTIAFSGVTNKSIAVYGNLTYEVVDGLFLTGGLRYTRDRVEDAYFMGSNPADLPTLKTSRVTPRAVIRYEFNNNTSVYASYARGYKAAIYNVGGNSTVPIAPEGIDAYEIGLKHAQSRMSVNISGYYYRYTDQQVTNGVLVNGVPLTRITNAASSNMYGIEGDFRFHVSPALTINGGASWSHARFDKFPNAPYFKADYSLGLTDGSGNHMLRAPDFTGNIGATYATGLADGELVLSGNLYYTSKFYFDVSEQLPQDDYAVLGLRAAWTDPTGKFTFALAGKNVTNSKYYTQAASNFAGVAAIWAEPATVEASVRMKFD